MVPPCAVAAEPARSPVAGFRVPDRRTPAPEAQPTTMARKPKPKRRPATATPKAKGGRPSDYRPGHCATVIELGREGKSRAQIAAALDVARQTIADWEKRHPQFLDAMTRAHDLALAWWEDQGQTGIWSAPLGRTLNSAAYGLQMRNRFASEYGRPDTVVDLNLDEVRASLESKLTRLAAGAAAQGVARKP